MFWAARRQQIFFSSSRKQNLSIRSTINSKSKASETDLGTTFCAQRTKSIALKAWIPLTSHQITSPVSVFLTLFCAWKICWAGDEEWRRSGLGWRKRWTSSPSSLWRMGSCRRQFRSHWESEPLCLFWPDASARFQSWTEGRCRRRSTASGRCPGLPTAGGTEQKILELSGWIRGCEVYLLISELNCAFNVWRASF